MKSRLEFIKELTATREAFRGVEKIEKMGETGWTHPFKHFSALRFYLILTCSDILGSNTEYIDFQSWLTSSKKKEREIVFENIEPKTLSPVAVKEVFGKYNEIHGISNGFKRFINEIITEDDRKNLINSIKIRKIGNNSNKELKYEASEDKKINFLYEIRNMFTHTGEPYASPGGGIFEDDGKSMIINGKEMWGFQPVHYIHKAYFYYEYSVRKWPQLLIEIVRNTIRNNEGNT